MMQYKHVCYITTAFRWFYIAGQHLIIFCTNEKQFISSVVQSCIVTPLQVLIYSYAGFDLLFGIANRYTNGYFYTISDFTRTHTFEVLFWVRRRSSFAPMHLAAPPPPTQKHLKSLWTPYWIWIVLIRYFKCRTFKRPYNLLRAVKCNLKYMTTKNVYCQIQCFHLHFSKLIGFYVL